MFGLSSKDRDLLERIESQNKSIIKLLMRLEKPPKYKIGDRIGVGDKAGIVCQVSLRLAWDLSYGETIDYSIEVCLDSGRKITVLESELA